MIKRTYADVKAELSRVASQTGLKADDPRLKELVFLAQERLSTKGEWVYQYARVKFRQIGGNVSLPSEYEALVHVALNKEPVEIQPPWFEFLEYGPGPVDSKNWASGGGVDQGESPVFYQPGSRPVTIKVTSTDGSDTGNVTVVGYDDSGVEKKVTFALPESTSAVKWSKISRVIKPVTLGDVALGFTDAFGNQTLGASYRRRDTTPTFRTYHFAGVRGNKAVVVDGIVRRRLFKITDDTDELFITNIGALRLAVKGLALEDKGDIASAVGAFEVATGILRDESKLYRASRNPSPVNVSKVASLSVRPDIH